MRTFIAVILICHALQRAAQSTFDKYLIDPFSYGNYKYELFDLTENNLIYSSIYS